MVNHVLYSSLFLIHFITLFIFLYFIHSLCLYLFLFHYFIFHSLALSFFLSLSLSLSLFVSFSFSLSLTLPSSLSLTLSLSWGESQHMNFSVLWGIHIRWNKMASFLSWANPIKLFRSKFTHFLWQSSFHNWKHFFLLFWNGLAYKIFIKNYWIGSKGQSHKKFAVNLLTSFVR